MAKYDLDAWEKRRKKLIDEFVEGWTWDRVVRNWQYRIEDPGVRTFFGLGLCY
ncbi:MAG: hypothetical protein GX167_06385 [Firmicutes bacterium]|jgi:hypothetical protein|nr:hypothetical protein [Bacillota bacterium]